MSNRIEIGVFRTNVQMRNARGERFRIFYLSSLIIAFVVLIALIASVINQTFGLVAVNYAVDPDNLIRPIELEGRIKALPIETLRGFYGDEPAPEDPATLLAQVYFYYTLIDQVANKRDAEIELSELASLPISDIMARVNSIENVNRSIRSAGLNAATITAFASNADLWAIILTPNNRTMEDLTPTELGRIIENTIPREILQLVFENLSPLSDVREMNGIPLSVSIAGAVIPEGWENRPINELSPSERVQLLTINLPIEQLLDLVNERVVKEVILQSWNLDQSLTNRAAIELRVEDVLPFGTELRWRSWISWDFITGGLTKNARNSRDLSCTDRDAVVDVPHRLDSLSIRGWGGSVFGRIC